MVKQIPNLFTLLNLVFGCIAIVLISQFDAFRSHDFSLFTLYGGCICIFLSAIVDFLDGFVARLFKATSTMGEQLDSLADAVSFGVAPGMIMYKLLEQAFYLQQPSQQNLWYCLPAVLISCAAVWRLAKFNLDKEQRYYFKGVPTPAAGLLVASLPFNISSTIGQHFLTNPFVLIGIIILLSWLMVSNLPLISLKFKSKLLKDNLDKIIIAAIAVISIIILQWLAVPVIFIAYLIVSLIFKPNKI